MRGNVYTLEIEPKTVQQNFCNIKSNLIKILSQDKFTYKPGNFLFLNRSFGAKT